ncbi:hypothetical protein DH2020_042483 [Rehmannia glutinosa]|uniref:Uncharacterized protein n=1 Tax=Rehmannia glutinosa TaxID=99300 RepID=A0ABR0UM95_REHGL
MAEKWEEMLKEVSELKQRVSGKEVVRRGIPFRASVMADELPANFRSLTNEYDGTTNPWEHMCRFKNSALLHRYSDGVKCRVFLTTLSQSAQQWFSQLPVDSIASFGESLAKRPVRDFDDILSRAEKYVNLEEAQKGKMEELRDKRKERVEVHRDVAPKQFWEQERRIGLVPRLKECRHLKDEIERMVKNGWLAGWVKTDQGQASNIGANRNHHPQLGGRGNDGRGKKDHSPRGTINMIARGPTDGDSNKARKVHAREEIQPIMEVWAVREPIVSFRVKDQRGVSPPHNDALVITTTIANFEVARIMVDMGSSVNVLFYEAYLRMGVEMEVKHMETALFGFEGRVVEPIGYVILLVTIGEQPRHKTRMVSFLIVDSFSTYNVIIGRPALNVFQAVVSTFHMKLKFVMEDGVGEVLGDQQMARKCYVEAVRKGEQKKSKRKEVESERETNPLKMTKRKEKTEPDMMSVKPQEKLMSVELVIGDPTKVTRIGTQLGSELAAAITSFLTENLDVFAWSAEDLGGVDLKKVTHHLNVDPERKPVNKKKRPFGWDKDKIIQEEVDKLLRADLAETFAVLKNFRMKLNPAKCSFGVRFGKFLGYMVTELVIEVNPEKVKALIDMASPTSINKVQQLMGRLAALSRFISKLAEKSFLFFKVLRKVNKFEWLEECERAFSELKAFLSKLPLLTKPVSGEDLYLR